MEQPNLVLIMTDQQRYDQLGFASDGHFETPVLDGLAADGVVFDSAYSAATTCVRARIGLLTGVQPRRVAKQPKPCAFSLAEGSWTFAHALRRAGYETALFGKMHFSPHHAEHGFDVMRTSEHLKATAFVPRPDGAADLDDYHQWLVEHGLGTWSRLEIGKPPVFDPIPRPEGWSNAAFPYELEYHPTTWVENEVHAFLDARDDSRPLCMVVSFPPPHPPLNPPLPYRAMFSAEDSVLPADGGEVNATLPEPFRQALTDGGGDTAGQWLVTSRGVDALRVRIARVRALVRQIDDAVGRIIDRLDLATTMVVFTSDHGDYAGHRGLGGKIPWIPFEDLIRVPLIVAGAGVSGGRRIQSTVQSSDVALTFCEIAGESVDAEEFDSRSLASLIAGRVEAQVDDRVALFTANPGWPGVCYRQLKLIRHPASGELVLFDLDEDPGERVNLAYDPSCGDELEELRHILDLAVARPAARLPSFAATG